MPNILISEEDAAEVVKVAKSTAKQSTISNAIISFISLVFILGLIAVIIIVAKNVSKRTQGLNQSYTTSGQNKSGAVSVPRPAPGLALPSFGGGRSAYSGGTSQNQMQAPASPRAMVMIPSGDYISGWDENGRAVKVNVPAFFMDIYEVTNQDYANFVKATGHKPPTDPRGSQYDIWTNGTYPAELADHPVVNVSYQDAEEYAKWAGKRLPTKEEWERANRGNEGFVYPWGDDYNPNSANGSGGNGATAPVGSFPYDRSPFGVFDMAGNVREWTSTPYSAGSQRWKIVKGGSFNDGPEGLSSYAEFKGTIPAPNLGFRCVRDVR